MKTNEDYYEVILKDTLTGVQKKITDDFGESGEFLWKEGNYSCDCNRSLFMGMKELECSGEHNRIQLVSIKKTTLPRQISKERYELH